MIYVLYGFVEEEASYSEFMKDQIRVAQLLFNFKHFQQRSSTLKPGSSPTVPMSILSKDPADLIQYGNKVFILRGIILKYILQLKQMEIKATGLIQMLKAEYDLK